MQGRISSDLRTISPRLNDNYKHLIPFKRNGQNNSLQEKTVKQQQRQMCECESGIL